jgi:N-acetylglucosamine-6-sulfatase
VSARQTDRNPTFFSTRRRALQSLAGGALGLIAGHPAMTPRTVAVQEDDPRPNIILILTDDMRADDLPFMPNVQSLLVEQGATFTTFAASCPACAPARASILRGQYPHNHGLLRGSGDTGGADVFQELGNEESNVATWLQEAGYRTALIGKYINGYGDTVEPTYIAPGWDSWSAITREGYSRFEINENGELVRYKSGEQEQHSTDVLSGLANAFIAETAPTGQPFFVHLSPRAPHGPAEPASRHLSTFTDAAVPRGEAFNETDVADKPIWVQMLPELTAAQEAEVDAYYRARLQTLLAVDELVAGLVDQLEAVGELENTYILFTSDNGYGLGEHRVVQDKGSPYEEAILVPFVVRGPGIPAGVTIEALASQVDLAPTFAAWAEVSVPDFVDGRSLLPVLSDEPTPADWRQVLLIEQFANNPARTEKQPAFEALRLPHLIYVEYGSDERELYDLIADPQQIENLAATADPALLAALSERVTRMETCAGDVCREVESEPLPAILATPTA